MTILWKIEKLDRRLPDEGVVTAHWRALVEEGGYNATIYGTVSFTPDPNSPTFKPYESLTQDEVLVWVWAQVERKQTEQGLLADIEYQRTPKIVSGLPWA